MRYWGYWVAGLLGVVGLSLWVRLGPIPTITPDTTPTIVDRNGIVLYEPLSAAGTRNEWLEEVPEIGRASCRERVCYVV